MKASEHAENLLQILSRLKQTAKDPKGCTEVVCYDSNHNRSFKLVEFVENLDDSDFSPGSLDLMICVEFLSQALGGFRIFELPSDRDVVWVCNLKNGAIKMDKILCTLLIAICKFFNFKFIMIHSGAVKIDSAMLIEQGFLRLVDADLKTVLYYLNISTCSK